MRKVIMAWRILKTGAKNFFRNSWLSIAATAVMVVALTIILSAIVLNVTTRNAIKELSKNLKVSVYLKDGVTEEKAGELLSELRHTNNVAEAKYVSSEAAREQFSKSFSNDQKLVEGLTLVGTDTLPPSIEISVNDVNRINEVGAVPKGSKYGEIVDSITLGKTDAKKTIDRAAAIQRFVTSASIFAAVLFACVSVLIIFNTIRMAIFTRGEEIRIMKLIGATPSYIRGPFIVEASMYGVVAGCIANAAVYSVIFSVGAKVNTQAEFMDTYNLFARPSSMLVLLFGAILGGIIVGVISSIFAMQKHLKLKHW